MIRSLAALLLTATVTSGLTSPSGEVASCDIPLSQHLANSVGRDGAGLCVFTSIDHAGRWHNVAALIGMRDYMKQFPGGGWPEKVDKYIARRCSELGMPIPKYVHLRSYDAGLLRAAIRNGFMVCVTYYVSPSGRYGGQRISHMVNLIHTDRDDSDNSESWGILDNNYPKTIEWLSRKEFERASGARDGHFWAMIFLEPPPPPVSRKGDTQ